MTPINNIRNRRNEEIQLASQPALQYQNKSPLLVDENESCVSYSAQSELDLGFTTLSVAGLQNRIISKPFYAVKSPERRTSCST